jgi:ATP-dependent DNA helicase PIF1
MSQRLVQQFSTLTLDDDAVELGTEQLKARELILESKNVFITGSAGTGKSVLLRNVRDALAARGKAVAICAPTGVAAEGVGGTTVHAVAGIGVPTSVADFCRKTSREAKERIQEYDAMIIDEISMVGGEFFDRLSEHFAFVRERPGEPFGGMQMIVLGDFFQLPPVEGAKQRRDAQKGFCPGLYIGRGLAFQSWSWGALAMHTCELTQVFRQSDNEFVDMLQRLRKGDVSVVDELSAKCHRQRDSGAGGAVTKIVATNPEANKLNDSELGRIRNERHVFRCEDTVESDQNSRADPDLLRAELGKLWKKSLEHQCRGKSELSLKVGAQVRLSVLMRTSSVVSKINSRYNCRIGYDAA